jgi:hypothetical protein
LDWSSLAFTVVGDDRVAYSGTVMLARRGDKAMTPEPMTTTIDQPIASRFALIPWHSVEPSEFIMLVELVHLVEFAVARHSHPRGLSNFVLP